MSTQLRQKFRRICVYCGSSNHVADKYFDAAREMGRLLAAHDIDVVFGGGRVGLMGAVADAALQAGGRVYGVIPHKLQELELGHTGCTELFVVDSMHARKMMMAQLSDGFVALPGGWGTMEELFEVTTWAQLNYHLKPIGALDVDGYYEALFAWVDKAVDEGFVRPMHQGLVCRESTPEALLRAMSQAEIPQIGRWIDRP